MISYIILVLIALISAVLIAYWRSKVVKLGNELNERTAYYENALIEKNKVLIKKNLTIQYLLEENEDLKRKVKEFDNS